MSTEMRIIPCLGGRYLATKDGKIWSVKRNRFRTQSVQRNGYLTITVRCPETKKTITKTVHSLIASAWLPNPKNLAEVNHIDGNKENNSVSNLEWCSRSQNMKHSWKSNLHKVTKGMLESILHASRISAQKSRRLSDEKLREAKQRRAAGETVASISKSFGISRKAVSNALNGKTYKEV